MEDIMIRAFIVVVLLLLELADVLETTVNYVKWVDVQVIVPLTFVVINPAVTSKFRVVFQ